MDCELTRRELVRSDARNLAASFLSWEWRKEKVIERVQAFSSICKVRRTTTPPSTPRFNSQRTLRISDEAMVGSVSFSMMVKKNLQFTFRYYVLLHR